MADRPVQWLRGLALSLERLAAQGVASGAVRGAAEELRAGVSEDVDAQIRSVLRNGFVVLERMVAEASESEGPPLRALARSTAEGAVQGGVEEMRRLVPEMRPMTEELFQRLRLWLDRSESEADARARAIRSPGDLARVAASGAIAGAAEQLSAALPALASPAADFAARVGQGVVRGAGEEVARQLRLAARSPVLRACAAGLAVLVLLGAAVRRR